MAKDKLFRIFDKLNVGYVGDTYKSEAEAKSAIKDLQLTPDLHEVRKVDEVKQLDGRENLPDSVETDYENRRRTSTYDHELVRKARQMGVNPDNFDDPGALGDAVRQREADDEAKAQEETNASEEEDERS